MKNIFICIVLCWFTLPLWAQITISSTVPSSGTITVCQDTGTFSCKVLANGVAATNVSLDIYLPPGLTYVSNTLALVDPGSKAVTFQNQLGNVISFSAADLGTSDSLYFSYGLSATCAALDYAQTAQTFKDTIVFNYNSGSSETFYTSTYSNAIIFPELSVFTPTTPSASVGEQTTREVRINNNGNACVDQIVWYDAHGSDITIDSILLNGQKLNITASGDKVYYTFSSTDFQLIGNGDGEFCNAELSFSITEYITLIGCDQTTSSIGASWGCGGDTCQVYTTNSDVSVAVASPQLSFTWRNNELPACYQEQANYKEVLIQNIGTGTAADIEIEIKKFFYGGQWASYKYDGLDQNSVVMKVGNGSFQPFTPHLIELNQDYTSCSQGYAYRFRMVIPDMDPGDSVVVGVNMINCSVDDGPNSNITQGALGYNYFFKNACLDNQWVVYNQPACPSQEITTNFSSQPMASILDGETSAFSISLSTANITFNGDGQFMLKQTMPDCGMTFSGLSSDVTWSNSTGNLSWTTDSISVDQDTIRAYFGVANMPVGFDLNGSSLELEVTGDCGCTDGISNRSFSQDMYYIPHTGCTDLMEALVYNYDGSVSVEICSSDPCNGPQIDAFSLTRKNTDTPDADLNRYPDAGPLDANIIRTDRVRLGDTLQAVVIATIDGTTKFGFGYVEMTIDEGAYLQPAGGTITVWDDSSSQYITCSTITPEKTSSTVFYLNIAPDSLALSCSGFNGINYDDQDTVWVTLYLLVSSNPSTSILNVSANPVNFYLQESPGDSLMDCGSGVFSGQFQIITMEDVTAINYLESNSCDSTLARTYIRQYVGNDKADIFPGEYRIWGYPDSIFVVPPASFNFVEAYILFRFNPYVRDAYPLPVNANADTLVFDVGSLFSGGTFLFPDDGYEFQFFTTWAPTCASPNDSAVNVPTTVTYQWESELEDTYTSSASYTPQVRHEAPILDLDNVSSMTQDGLTREVTWTIRLHNISQTSSAIYPWISLDSPTGRIEITSLQDTTNDVTIAATGEIYQLSNFAANEYREYLITATYETCIDDTLMVYAGWNCQGYPTTVAAYPCTPETFSLMLDPKPAAGKITMDSEPASTVDLCTPIPYEFSISSSLVANVENVTLDFIDPTGGLSFSTNTLQIAYPLDSGYTTVSDPAAITGGYRLDLDSYLPSIAADGLPGLWVTNPDLNKINFRMSIQASCDFISGDVFYMYLRGTKPCGDSIETYLAVSQPIQITGATEPYQAEVSLDAPDLQSCGQYTPLEVKAVISGGTTLAGDKIYLTLPVGILSDTASLASIRNGPSGATLSITDLGLLGQRLEWDMPVGIVSGDSIVFSIDIAASSTASCGVDNYAIKVNTVFQTQLSCGTGLCSMFQVATGTEVEAISVEKPELTITDLNATSSAQVNRTQYKIWGIVKNEGLTLDTPSDVFIECYCDSDHDNAFSQSGDSLIGVINSLTRLGNSNNYSFAQYLSTQSTRCSSMDAVVAVVQRDPQPDSIDYQCLCDDVYASYSVNPTLPVEWLEFTAQLSEAGVALHWRTSNEAGTDFYSVERSLDGEDFELINTLPKNESLAYSYQDMELPQNRQRVVYYRIRQTDLNGHYTFSEIRTVMLRESVSAIGIQVSPNPASEEITVHWKNLAGQGRLQILNSLNQVVMEAYYPAFPLEQSLLLPVNSLPSGLYFVRIQDDTHTQVAKFRIE